MKRLFAIVILNIFLLNVLGYYGVLLGLKVNAGQELSEALDSEMYDLGATITFKIPLSIPYATDSENYSRVDGQFEKDGVVYRMVKQRIFEDTLYIVCIKDDRASKFNSALTDIAQGFAGNEDGDSKSVAPGFIKDFLTSITSVVSSEPGWQLEVASASATRLFFDSYFASIVHPPDRLACA